MTVRTACLALVLFGLITGPATAQTPDAGPIVEQAITGVIQPRFEALVRATGAMQDAFQPLCGEHDRPALDAARAEYGRLVATWSGVEFARIGPLAADNRTERFLFWPDRRGRGLSQVQAIIAEMDESAAAPESLAGKSVAVQGLGALEFVLFGTGSDSLAEAPGEGFRCRYGRAIAANLATIAGAVSDEWRAPDGFAATWRTPSADNPLYRDGNEQLASVLKLASGAIELMREQRLRPIIGDGPDDFNGKAAIYWRSANTTASMIAGLEAIRDLIDHSAIRDAVPPEQHSLMDNIDFDFDNGIAALEKADPSLADLQIKTEDGGGADYKQLRYVGVVLNTLFDELDTKLPAVFGLSTGFTALDGD